MFVFLTTENVSLFMGIAYSCPAFKHSVFVLNRPGCLQSNATLKKIIIKEPFICPIKKIELPFKEMVAHLFK